MLLKSTFSAIKFSIKLQNSSSSLENNSRLSYPTKQQSTPACFRQACPIRKMMSKNLIKYMTTCMCTVFISIDENVCQTVLKNSSVNAFLQRIDEKYPYVIEYHDSDVVSYLL